ncbi:PREDICTED: protein FAM110C [Haliaeetus leucocephalus]|uniref:protein FAM110C n=1 Tax=Haliaeetus leucocephalus TaxID=52644 RepID=UPI00053CE716|nr:PREDICTED: protein FAM110C [Haliaeetus leucocephalus]
MPTELSRAVGMHAISDLHSPLTLRLLNKGPEYLRRQLEAGSPGRRSAVERLAADRAKYVKSQRAGGARRDPVLVPSSASESGSETCSHGPPIARRGTPKRQLRPDSLVIYRQKCEFGRGQSQDGSRGSLVRRIFQGSLKEKRLASPEIGAPGAGGPGERGRPSEPSTPPEEAREVKRRGLHRSQSDISSRYSRSFSEFDTFFKYCGLEQEVIEDLGRENFSVVSDNVSFKIRSISVATSESDFTRHSGDEGLLEDELTEQVPSSTSVIERNARIIKWLYTCKKAKETNKVIQELA